MYSSTGTHFTSLHTSVRPSAILKQAVGGKHLSSIYTLLLSSLVFVCFLFFVCIFYFYLKRGEGRFVMYFVLYVCSCIILKYVALYVCFMIDACEWRRSFIQAQTHIHGIHDTKFK